VALESAFMLPLVVYALLCSRGTHAARYCSGVRLSK